MDEKQREIKVILLSWSNKRGLASLEYTLFLQHGLLGNLICVVVFKFEDNIKEFKHVGLETPTLDSDF